MHTDRRPVVLITGSEGFIGDALAQALEPRYRVAGFDVRRPHKAAPALRFIHCDLADDGSVRTALDELRRHCGSHIASVVHLAGYDDDGLSPLSHEHTVNSAARLLRGLRDFEVDQFIFCSTPIAANSFSHEAYPQPKLEAERVLQREHGSIPVVILRIGGVYDEQGHTAPIAQQIDRIARKDLQSYLFPGDRGNWQAYVHLDDLVDLVRRAIDRRDAMGSYEVFLVAEPDKMEYGELREQIGRLVHGESWRTVRIPKVVARVGAWVTNQLNDESFLRPWTIDVADDDYPIPIDQARDKLGWNPQRRLRATLPAIVANMKRDPEAWRELNGIPNLAGGDAGKQKERQGKA